MREIKKSLPDRALAAYVVKQLNQLFDDGRTISEDAIHAVLPEVMRRVEHCFSRIGIKYFFDGENVTFNHLNSDQYAMFLYLLGNIAYKTGAVDDLPSKAYLLNKALHGIDAFYEVDLPSIFLFAHPLATVLGRGKFSDYLLVYQSCNVGMNNMIYPELGEFVTLRPGASVLGKCRIGRNCTIAAGSLILDDNLADNLVYIGEPRNFTTRAATGVAPVWRI
jgi:serine O-acetyltransferase